MHLLPEAGLDDCGRLDFLIVVAGLAVQRLRDPAVIATLRRQGRSGCRLGALSTGSYLLAWAGLLDGYRCTVHWENLDAFREDFPSLDVTGELFEIDGPRLTCRSEEQTSELQSLMRISYAVFCLKKKNRKYRRTE